MLLAPCTDSNDFTHVMLGSEACFFCDTVLLGTKVFTAKFLNIATLLTAQKSMMPSFFTHGAEHDSS